MDPYWSPDKKQLRIYEEVNGCVGGELLIKQNYFGNELELPLSLKKSLRWDLETGMVFSGELTRATKILGKNCQAGDFILHFDMPEVVCNL